MFSKTLLCNSDNIDVITSVFISFLIAPCLMYNVIYPITLDACRLSVLEKRSERYGKESASKLSTLLNFYGSFTQNKGFKIHLCISFPGPIPQAGQISRRRFCSFGESQGNKSVRF